MITQAELDAAARQKGFKNYAQYQAWDAHTRQVVLNGNPSTGAPPGNWLQNLMEKIPLHPAMLFRYINDNLEKAGK